MVWPTTPLQSSGEQILSLAASRVTICPSRVPRQLADVMNPMFLASPRTFIPLGGAVPAWFPLCHHFVADLVLTPDCATYHSAIDASVAAGGVAWSPPNGTHLLGAGLKFIGHWSATGGGAWFRYVCQILTPTSASTPLANSLYNRFRIP